jgi:hypothetical protein
MILDMCTLGISWKDDPESLCSRDQLGGHG